MADLTDNDALIQAAELGEEARKFLDGNLGKKLIDLADEDVHEALLALGAVNPDDTVMIRRLQAKVMFGQLFAGRLMNLVHEGEQAIQVFKQQNET